MTTHQEIWKDQHGNEHRAIQHPGKYGGDDKVWTVNDPNGNKLGHITSHPTTINRHGIFDTPNPFPPLRNPFQR